MRIPQYILNYGYLVYNTCVKTFRKGALGTKYKFTILEYILYRASSLTILIKPLTYRVRILSINGGGIRGVVPLEFLILL